MIHRNEPLDYAIAALTFLALTTLVLVARRYGPVSRRLRARRDAGSATAFDRYALAQIDGVFVPLALTGAFFAGVATLHIAAALRHGLRELSIAIAAWAFVRFALGFVVFGTDRYVERNARRGLQEAHVRAFLPFVQIVAWGLALIFVLDDWGFHVSALVAGLGIGGAAVALAAQAILKDWFGYVAIVSDRPFEIGHLVAIGPEYVGTVVDITVRSVRLRAVTGEELILPNADVATARVRNYSRAAERRVAFAFGVASRDAGATLDGVPDLVRAAIEAQPGLRFERCVWTAFGDVAHTFEASYLIAETAYEAHLAPQHAINVALARAFRAAGLALAAPAAAGLVLPTAPAAPAAALPLP